MPDYKPNQFVRVLAVIALIAAFVLVAYVVATSGGGSGSGGGWKLNAELPGTAAFAAASKYVTEDDIAESIACGPDLDRHLEGIRQFKEAGFTHLALVQIGGEHQRGFIEWAAETPEVSPATCLTRLPASCSQGE